MTGITQETQWFVLKAQLKGLLSGVSCGSLLNVIPFSYPACTVGTHIVQLLTLHTLAALTCHVEGS